MIAVIIPSHATVEAALDWLAGQGGTVVRVCLLLGMDGMIRGNALIRRASDGVL